MLPEPIRRGKYYWILVNPVALQRTLEMTNRPLAIVIGAGHNGMVCSNYLALAGYQVKVLEARESIGGSAATIEFAQGFRAPGLINSAYGLNKKIYKDLKLSPRDGLPSENIDCIALNLKGEHLTLTPDNMSGVNISQKDLCAYRNFKKEFKGYANALNQLMTDRPPRLKDMDRKDKFSLARLGWSLRFGLGKNSMREFLRVGGINIFDVLNEHFDNPHIKATLAVDAIMGQRMGPRTPNTVLTYIQRVWAQTHAAPQLSSATHILEALHDSAESAGVHFRPNSKVRRVLVDRGRAVGVQLESGEEITASIVVSNADAKTTFLQLVGTHELDAMFCHRIDHVRCEGNVAKIYYAVKRLPQFANLEQKNLRYRLLIAPDQQYVEHAFNHVKYGEYSENPVLEFTVPSLVNPALAPEGFHVIAVSAAYAPYTPKMGWNSLKSSYLNGITSKIEQYAPGFAKSVEVSKLLTPADLEEQYNNIGGHWHNGELSLDQSFMMRPVFGASQYDTPIKGLFLCGACTHPGGGITGVPGHNAAKRILELGGRV